MDGDSFAYVEVSITEIQPEQNIQVNITESTDLKQKVIATAEHIMDEWESFDEEIE